MEAAGAQLEATQPTMPQAQEETETPADGGVLAKDTQHEPAASAAAASPASAAHSEARVGCDDELADQFGCERIDSALVQRVARLTSRPPHRFLRRRVFFAHRDLDRVLDLHDAGEKFYLFTGREPSPEPLHLGHLVPLTFAKYLQDAFRVPVVVQLRDDATFLRNCNLTVAECKRLAREDAKDVIACGFDVERTFIFTNFSYTRGEFYENINEVAKRVLIGHCTGEIGLTREDNIGMFRSPAAEAAPSLPSSFPHLFPRSNGGDQQPRCLIPCAAYQDPCLGMIRDVAPEIGFQKPALIESKVLPALQGGSSKMSAGDPNYAIYVTDSPKQIKTKVNRYAFSGGQSSVELHRKLGADLDVDVSIKYLEFFLEDDDELERIKEEYREGRMLTGEVKQCLVAAISEMVSEHQRARAKVTEEMVDAFMAVRPLPNMFG